ncbi:hypothetical protein AX16_006462 [Volvariella volvacea WC 439]|nr:hypothetical protein AX16_006462 [Volvariella volvacea WC 439]
MDFTETYNQSNQLVAFSPGAHFLLVAVNDRVIVRRCDTLQITRSWLLDVTPSPTTTLLSSMNKSKSNAAILSQEHPITHAAWSCDSEYILAACARHGVVHILKLTDEDWSGRIDAGAEGLTRAEWAPDGRTILCFSDWGLRVTVWSLVTGNAIYIQFPIYPDKGYAFRRDGRYFVLAERHKSKDTVGVYDTSDAYRLVRHFPLPTTSVASLSLSPTGNHLAIWEGPLEYKLHILTLTGTLLRSFTPEPDPGFGIRNVAWHPGGAFIAVGGWDDKIHILDNVSWSPVATLQLHTRIPSRVAVWREPQKWLESTEGRGFLSFERLQGSQVIPFTKPDPTKANPKSGVIQLEWNTNGRLLLARFENVPTAVYLFTFPSHVEPTPPQLRSVIWHSRPVLRARWNPVRPGSLITCCGGEAIYSWSDEWVNDDGEEEEMAECIGIPTSNFDNRDLNWAPDGKGFVLLDKEQFCCAFEVESDSGLADP